jgi:hypothetical protein
MELGEIGVPILQCRAIERLYMTAERQMKLPLALGATSLNTVRRELLLSANLDIFGSPVKYHFTVLDSSPVACFPSGLLPATIEERPMLAAIALQEIVSIRPVHQDAPFHIYLNRSERG